MHQLCFNLPITWIIFLNLHFRLLIEAGIAWLKWRFPVNWLTKLATVGCNIIESASISGYMSFFKRHHMNNHCWQELECKYSAEEKDLHIRQQSKANYRRNLQWTRITSNFIFFSYIGMENWLFLSTGCFFKCNLLSRPLSSSLVCQISGSWTLVLQVIRHSRMNEATVYRLGNLARGHWVLLMNMWKEGKESDAESSHPIILGLFAIIKQLEFLWRHFSMHFSLNLQTISLRDSLPSASSQLIPMNLTIEYFKHKSPSFHIFPFFSTPQRALDHPPSRLQ